MENLISTDSAKTILLVDDEESIMFFLQKLLIREGYNIIKASNGKEAVEIYKSNSASIDLILMDIAMPVMSGIDAYKELSTHDPNVTILMMSAYSMESFDEMEKINFIRKPIYPTDLIEEIGKLLESNTG